ncbi:MAG TPA: sulfotransferase [Woeseiaceae bacterium]|nr:sulfotransferase [Woeseiaceae bacterium]
MNRASDFEAAFEQARKLHVAGRLHEAERAYRELDIPPAAREAVLRALAELYLQSGRSDDAVAVLVALTDVVPDRLFYYGWLADVLEGLGRLDAAIEHYRRLLERRPRFADAYFNVALLYKKNRDYPGAVAAYEEAARLGIGNVQEVWSNLGVLYSEIRDPHTAAAMYERALDVDPHYVPALCNYAGLLEEAGTRDRALELYRRILDLEPGHAAALSRLVYANRVTSRRDPLIDRLQRELGRARDAAAREELSFALGKALDDLGDYDGAFAAYRAANELGRQRMPAYDRQAAEQAFARLIDIYNAGWIDAAATGSDAMPVFICGMFRSGSTLVEQILGAHPDLTAGGELDLLPWLIGRRLAPYPERIAGASREELRQLGDEYLARLHDLFPGAGRVTDKRPDNFLHLGLIKAVFPRARMIYTTRDPRDTCLSIYFQQLGGNLGYSTDLGDSAHYHGLHDRLMSHWKACFGGNIHAVDYDELVRAPEPVLRSLLDFLGLEWDERCLAFQQTDSLVKTASVWQVREGLHARSSGRWKHYARYFEGAVVRPRGRD